MDIFEHQFIKQSYGERKFICIYTPQSQRSLHDLRADEPISSNQCLIICCDGTENGDWGEPYVMQHKNFPAELISALLQYTKTQSKLAWTELLTYIQDLKEAVVDKDYGVEVGYCDMSVEAYEDYLRSASSHLES